MNNAAFMMKYIYLIFGILTGAIMTLFYFLQRSVGQTESYPSDLINEQLKYREFLEL